MVPNKFSMVDLDGIDIVESQGVEIPGLYQKLTNAIAQCRYQVLYNWKFDSIIIPPSYVEMVVDGNEVKINDNISVSDSDIVYIHSLEPPGPEPVLVSLTATENGIYLPALGQDGFSEVNVNLSIPQPYDSSPVEDGVESPGLSNQWSRGDHVHPTDTSRQAKITASGLLVGDGAGGVSAKTLDTSSLTDDADHVPVSSVVKSAFDYKVKTSPTIYDATRLSSVSGGYVVKGNIVYIQMQFTVNGSWSVPSTDTFRLFSDFPAPQFNAQFMAIGNGSNALWNIDFLVRTDGAAALFNKDAEAHTIGGVTFTVTGSYVIA